MPHPAASSTGTDNAFTAADQPAVIDPETRGLLWRVADNFTTLAERYAAAREAAGYGPGASENHVLTRNRLSREPARLRTDGSIADAEATELLRRIRNGRDRLRTLAHYLDRALTAPITDAEDADLAP